MNDYYVFIKCKNAFFPDAENGKKSAGTGKFVTMNIFFSNIFHVTISSNMHGAKNFRLQSALRH